METRPKKPSETRERLFLSACDVIKTAQKPHQRGPIAGALSVQLVNAAMNAAANVEEADVARVAATSWPRSGSGYRSARPREWHALRDVEDPGFNQGRHVSKK